jgi:hypothetical protein
MGQAAGYTALRSELRNSERQELVSVRILSFVDPVGSGQQLAE